MPWVKDFDEEEVLERAMEVFWAKGYEATSISDLLEAMQINKGSLYNAFGSKSALFIRALLKYDAEHLKAALVRLSELDSPLSAIDAFFCAQLEQSRSDKECKGCLLVNTTLDLPNQAPEVQRIVVDALHEIEVFFKRLVKLGQKRGEIAADLDPGDAAKWLLTQTIGLRVVARGAFNAHGLSMIRAQVLRHLKPA